MNEHHIKNWLDHPTKITWACRRGMLELDVLLGNFYQEAFHHLALADQKQFIILLQHHDPDLYSWLMGHEEVADSHLKIIVAMIRDHARKRI